MTTREPVRRYAPGKLLLFGEHAAVYGHPAIGVALDRGLTVVYTPGSPWELSLAGEPPVEVEVEVDFSRFFVHLESVVPLPPGTLDVQTEIPISGGFGSSAALCTAIASIALTVAGAVDAAATSTPLDTHRIWTTAHQLERFFHGTPSGIDTGLSALGGVQAFFFTPAPGQLPRAVGCAAPGSHLVVGSIPRSANTRSLVDLVRSRRDRDREETDRRLRRLGDNTRRITADGTPVTPEQLGALATAAHTDLAHLGVSTPELDSILAAGCRAGALGGKLSGAGGGGAFFLVCASDGDAVTVQAAIQELLPPGSTSFTMTI